MPLSLLSLDGSFPVEDAFHASNSLGQIRFFNATDALTLPALQRLQGDLVNRFILHEAKINSIVLAIADNPSLDDWDDSAYLKADGTVAFTEPVSGARPTNPSHLATKDYVDGEVVNLNESLTNISQALGNLQGVRSVSSPWVYSEWRAGQRVILSLPLSEEISDETKILSISVLEAIDTAQTGPENFTYRPVSAVIGARVDDIWMDRTTVKLAIPNNAIYPTGYPTEYSATMTPRARKYRATVYLAV